MSIKILDESNLDYLIKTVDFQNYLEKNRIDFDGLYFKLDAGLEFHEKIGEGGLGEVWRGYLVGRNDKKEVAIKVSKKTNLEHLRREAHIAGQLKHDDIGEILLYEEHNEKGMIIMEYIDGRNLLKIMDKHKKLGLRMPQKFTAFISRVCCDALKYAHNIKVYDETRNKEVIGVIHMDISPANIIINNNGSPKLVDFGLGITSLDLDDHIIRNEIAGKIGFMAPEIINRESIKGGKIDHRVDIYGLGITMDYLIRGRVPLIEKIAKLGKIESIVNIQEALKTDFKPLKEDGYCVDEKFSNIIEKATKIDRKKRYRSAFEMKEDIRRYLFGDGLGTDRDRLKFYLDLIYTPGMITYLEKFKNGETNIEFPSTFKNKVERIKKLMPYMVRNGKFCLETLKDSGYKTEEPGYLPIY